MQHLNYITYAKYEGDEYITQQLINYQDYSTTIDNSTHVDVDGDFHGDIETTNVNAVGEGAMAAGENLAADGAQVIDGDNLGTALANSGDGAVQNVGQIDGPVSTGDGNVQAGRDIGPRSTPASSPVSRVSTWTPPTRCRTSARAT